MTVTQTGHEFGKREGLVVSQREVRVDDVEAIAGRAAHLHVVRQRKELVVQAARPRRLGHGFANLVTG
jgi:hypothetical protein